MKPTARVIVLCAAALLGAVGCGNPADSVPQAFVGEVPPTPGGDVPLVDTTVAQPVDAGAQTAQVFTFSERGSSVEWLASKVTRSHNGGFRKFAGTIRLVDGAPTISSVQVVIETGSLLADNPRLTVHLLSPDFFAVQTYPTATFTSTRIAPGDAPNQYAITGNLELKDVTKSLTFPAMITVAEDHVMADAEFFFRRKDFNIVYDGMADDLIRDEVVLRLKIRATPVPPDTAGAAT